VSDDWAGACAAFAEGADASARERTLQLLARLEELPLGETRLLADADGRRYRAQRSQFYDRGFARHFLLVEELTEELDSSERATYEKLVRVLAHEVNNTVAATGSVLDSLLFYKPQLNDADRGDFGTAIEAVKRRNASLGEFIERFTHVVKMPAPEPRPTDLRELLEDLLRLYREPGRARGVEVALGRVEDVPLVPLDRNLFEQALLNIAKNAVEAAEASARERGAPGRVEFELFREGEHAEFWWVLVDGAIDLIRHAGREDVVVGRMDVPGRWAGGFRAWDEHGVYLATGRGVVPGRVLRVPATVLRERASDCAGAWAT